MCPDRPRRGEWFRPWPSLQFEDPVHPLGDVPQVLLVALVHLGRGPAVVADLAKGLDDLRPVLIAVADPHPLFCVAVPLEVELEHPLAELADPLRRRHAILDHVRAVEIPADPWALEGVDV